MRFIQEQTHDAWSHGYNGMKTQMHAILFRRVESATRFTVENAVTNSVWSDLWDAVYACGQELRGPHDNSIFG